MKKLKNLFDFGLLLMAAVVAVSCGDKEAFDGSYANQKKLSDYSANFIKKYGDVSGKTWDFSSDSHVYSLSMPNPATARAATRAFMADPASYLSINDWYEEQRNGGSRFKAEEWITDENALNKKRTKLAKISGKFRVKTVDRVQDIFDHIGSGILAQ